MRVIRKRMFVLLFLALFMVSGAADVCFSNQAEVIATGSVTGVYYPLGGAMANIISDKVDGLTVTVESTGGSVANIRMVQKGDVAFAFTGSTTVYNVFNGYPPYEKQPAPSVRAIAALYPEVLQIVVRKDSGLKNFDDLKGKRVGLGAPGSGTAFSTEKVLSAHGITIKDFKAEYLDFAECVTALKDKNIDAGVIFAGAPTAAVMDLWSTVDLDILQIGPSLMGNQEILEQFLKENPSYTISKIPAGTYEKLDYDILTLAVPAIMITYEDFDENIVYEVTKAIFENLDVIGQSHAQGKNISLENATGGVPIPFHPGAKKYFLEKGILKD
jgi:TRAP transporter TAXI family solute receptor